MEYLNCWESKFQLCEYSGKLLSLIADLNTIVKIPVNIEIIKKACYYARIYHGDQKRKSGEPYYSHPIIVAYLFAEYTGNNKQIYFSTDLIVIAILHDCLEDTTLTYDMIAKIFNRNIADGVQDLTRLKNAIKTTAVDTVNSLLLQHKKGTLYIKLFDRLHNKRTLKDMSPKKILNEMPTFLYLATYLEVRYVEEEFYQFCLFNTNTTSLKSNVIKNYLYQLFYLQDFLLPSPIFQNEVYQIENQYLSESL